MRLTLRTLLAYLDGLLDPKDADELGKKIEESEYATSLVHRIRDVMRRLRLGAPSLTDRGPGLDPNTVAEYLDNTLNSERVTDFEKVCLDSDIHLAEVASCHQILTLVLGEPAEVDPASRRADVSTEGRAGASGAAVAAERRETAGPARRDGRAATGPGRVGPAERKARLKPTVPEYLREPRRKPAWVSIVAAAVLVVCVTVIVLKSLGQFEPRTPLGKVLVSLGRCGAGGADRRWRRCRKEKDGRRNRRQPQSRPPKPSSRRRRSRERRGEAPRRSTAQGTFRPIGRAAGQAGRPMPKGVPSRRPRPPDQAAPGAAAPAVPPGTGRLTPPPGPQPPPTPEPSPKSLPRLPPMPGIEEEKQKPPEAQPAPQPPAPLPEPLGRLMSSDQVLLGRDAAGDWTRVGANQMLVPQQVLVLPTYRAKVALTVGVTLEILGGTRLELLGTAPPLPPGIRVHYGRVVLMPLGKAGSKLRVAFGDRTGTITFVDAESVAALDVRRLRLPGTNPETEPPRIAATLYAITGAVLWEEKRPGEGGPAAAACAAATVELRRAVDFRPGGRQGVAQVDHGRADQGLGPAGVAGDGAGVGGREAGQGGPPRPARTGHLPAAAGSPMAGAAESGLPRPVRRNGRRPGRSRPQARLAGLLRRGVAGGGRPATPRRPPRSAWPWSGSIPSRPPTCTGCSGATATRTCRPARTPSWSAGWTTTRWPSAA